MTRRGLMSRWRPIGVCWSRPCALRVTGCSRSIRRPSTAIGSGMRCRARSRTRWMRWCWPTCCAPDGDRHRQMPNDSEQVEAIAVLGRAHQDAVRAGQRDANRLRSLLREFFPAAVAAFPRLSTRSALTILTAAPTPAVARALTPEQIRSLLRLAGRVGIRTSEVERLHRTFNAEQLHQPPPVEDAMGEAVRSIVTTLMATQAAIADPETALAARFDNHPDAEILRSLPGLGVVLGGRVLGEFGDDPTRFTDAASRRRYAGTAPVTRASG